jgi:hypothetical protein
VLDAEQIRPRSERLLPKAFHVSPFMPMDVSYRWNVTDPRDTLSLFLENFREGERFFDVRMNLRRREISSGSLARVLISYPLMAYRVITAIYWQAFRLWLKGCPRYPHPRKAAGRQRSA